jgi:predicted ATP-dependent Lon-type protease
MISLELRNQVKERIDQVNDAYLLEEILNLIDFETSNEEIFSIPLEHQKELDISINQMKNGQIISNEMVDHKVQKWLSK